MHRTWAVVTIVLLVGLAGGSTHRAAAQADEVIAAYEEPIDGVVAGVARSFEAANQSLVGVGIIQTGAAEFDDEDAAADALQAMIDRYLAAATESGADTSGLRRASAPELGDEAVLYAGPVPIESGGTTYDFAFAILVVRSGVYVQQVVAIALAEDPLPIAIEIAEAIIGDEPGEELARGEDAPTDGSRGDGLWALLPTLEDLPAGFVVEEERIPPIYVGNQAATEATPAVPEG